MRPAIRAFAILLVCVSVAAQVRESITVSYVEIPVTVVDRSGNPVRGLKAENFQVTDDGEARAITSFDTVDFASFESVKATSPLNPVARRNFLLVFDLTFASPTSVSRAQQAARDFVRKMVEPRDRVGIATIDVAHGYRLLTALTTDRALLEAAIASPRSFRGYDPLQLAGNLPFGETPVAGLEQNQDIGTSEIADVARRLKQRQDDYNRMKIERALTLLGDLSKTLRAVSGQKHVVLLSEGFDPRLIQGRVGATTQDQTEETEFAQRGELWKIDSDNRYGSTITMRILEAMSEAAKKSDVIIDAIDIRGVRSDVDPSKGYQPTSNEALHLVARSTGGAVFQHSNDLASDFQRVLHAQEVVYVLGFQAPAKQPGRFHTLKVKVNGATAVARVSHRAGYFEAGGETQEERSLSNAEIVLNDIPQDGVHMHSLAAAFSTSGDRAQVPVILEINGADVAAAAKDGKATALIYLYAFDDEGLVRDSLFDRLRLDLQKTPQALMSNGIRYYATLSLPRGNYAVKALIRLPDGRKGFSRSDVFVPGADDVAVSQPLFFADGKDWLMVRGASHDATNSGYPFVWDGSPFVPAAVVHVDPSRPQKFALFIAHAAPDELEVETDPPARVVARAETMSGSRLMMEMAPTATAVSRLTVRIRKAGGADERTSAVPLNH